MFGETLDYLFSRGRERSNAEPICNVVIRNKTACLRIDTIELCFVGESLREKRFFFDAQKAAIGKTPTPDIFFPRTI